MGWLMVNNSRLFFPSFSDRLPCVVGAGNTAVPAATAGNGSITQFPILTMPNDAWDLDPSQEARVDFVSAGTLKLRSDAKWWVLCVKQSRNDEFQLTIEITTAFTSELIAWVLSIWWRPGHYTSYSRFDRLHHRGTGAGVDVFLGTRAM